MELKDLKDYVAQLLYNTRGSDINAPKFVQISTERDIYKYSFYPRTIAEGNSTPPDITKSTNVNSFKKKCAKLLSVKIG